MRRPRREPQGHTAEKRRRPRCAPVALMTRITTLPAPRGIVSWTCRSSDITRDGPPSLLDITRHGPPCLLISQGMASNLELAPRQASKTRARCRHGHAELPCPRARPHARQPFVAQLSFSTPARCQILTFLNLCHNVSMDTAKTTVSRPLVVFEGREVNPLVILDDPL